MIAGWWRRRRDARTLAQRAIPEELWRLTLSRFPFLVHRSVDDLQRLRDLSTLFLADKEFAGMQGLDVDDGMAVAIAAQACLPRLRQGFDALAEAVDLVRAQEQGSRLSMNELLATCRVLLTAGHETTVNLIGNGMLALFRHPSQRAELAADPSLLPNAVEELLRYDSPLQLTLRFAFEDTQLQGQTIKRGELLVLLLGGANRDPAQFADPDQLELRRKNASTHLSFGQGIHYCLGASLARLEGEIAIGALLRRFPDMKLATPELKWRRNITLRGLQSLRVWL